jgi:hypothetical protein
MAIQRAAEKRSSRKLVCVGSTRFRPVYAQPLTAVAAEQAGPLLHHRARVRRSGDRGRLGGPVGIVLLFVLAVGLLVLGVGLIRGRRTQREPA